MTQPNGPRAFLYTGHMIDAPDRDQPRFPPSREGGVKAAIALALDGLQPRPGEVAVGGGACGSDLLFAEALLQRGLELRLYLPFPEPEFLERSVAFAGRDWVARYRAVAAAARVQVATEVLGPLAAGTDPYERANLWMLDEARRIGSERVVLLCVWDGQGGDGPGGTSHMVQAVRAGGGEAHRIAL